MELMGTVLLTLTGKSGSIVQCAESACEFAILGNLDGGFIVDHEDGRDGWETLRRFVPLFCAKVEHIIEKHSNVGSGHVAEHAAIYLASEVDFATGVGKVEFALMKALLWKIM